jgi:hypothetical protein
VVPAPQLQLQHRWCTKQQQGQGWREGRQAVGTWQALGAPHRPPLLLRLLVLPANCSRPPAPSHAACASVQRVHRADPGEEALMVAVTRALGHLCSQHRYSLCVGVARAALGACGLF